VSCSNSASCFPNDPCRAVQRRGDPGKRWLTFLRNHREAIVALDFFTVPTVSFRVLYCLFVIEHARRRILHFHVTAHPDSDWVAQQLREASPDSTPYRYAILDRDTKFAAEVLNVLRSMGLKPKRTSRESPWQNGVAERWIGSCRRELLDHVIPLDERHLRRLIRDYVRYYHLDRTHDGLGKDTPNRRSIENNPGSGAKLFAPSGGRPPSSLRLATGRLTLQVRTGGSLRAPGAGVSVAAILLKIESHPFGYRDAIRANFTELNKPVSGSRSSLPPACRRRDGFGDTQLDLAF